MQVCVLHVPSTVVFQAQCDAIFLVRVCRTCNAGAASSKQQELHCCYLEQRSHLLQKQGQALHSLPMKTRVGVILPRTTPQLPQPVHDTVATAVAEQLLLRLVAASVELLLQQCCCLGPTHERRCHVLVRQVVLH